MSEQLFRCPCCQTAGFTANGLHRHHCASKLNRARLTIVEISQAQPVKPEETVTVMTKEKGGCA